MMKRYKYILTNGKNKIAKEVLYVKLREMSNI